MHTILVLHELARESAHQSSSPDMCDYCMQHGAGGKWYLNATHYSNEVVEKYNMREFLLEQYANFEQIAVRKVAGFSPAGIDHAFRMPIIGRVVKTLAERVLHSRRPPTNPFRPDGHIGQVVPLEDAGEILLHCAAEPIIEKNCMCRYMTRGMKEACCISFGVMSEIIDKLPRFIPEKEKYHLTREEAVSRFREHNNKGYIGSVWFGPFPYINNLCSCESPECVGLRPRLDFGIKSIYKAEYLIELSEAACRGCGVCVTACAFGAICMDRASARPVVDRGRCYGCGVCRHVCPPGALFLAPRDRFPAFAGKY